MVSIQKERESIKFTLSSGVLLCLLSFALLSTSHIVGSKFIGHYDKGAPYECGFDPIRSGYIRFSLRYFLIAVIFLIFDVEIALLLPLVVIGTRSTYLV